MRLVRAATRSLAGVNPSAPDPDALAAVGDALLGIAGELSSDVVLHNLVDAARRLARADYAALGTPDGDGGFDCWISSGLSDEEIEAIGPLPRTHGVLGQRLADSMPYRSTDVRSDPDFGGWWPRAHPEMQPFLAVPVTFRGEVLGAFYLANDEGGRSFDDLDEARVTTLATHAAVLIEHAQLYERATELSILNERNRLARDLHDAMTQTMFSLRLTVETAASLVKTEPGAAADALGEARALVDQAFAELRSLVFQLRPPTLEEQGLAATVSQYVDVVGRANQLRTRVEADPDLALAPTAESHLFRIVQEAVTNAVRHAEASAVEVQLRRTARGVRATVTDDGRGFDVADPSLRARHLGLTSMQERAELAGGHLTVTSTPGAGTAVEAVVPGG